MTALQIILKAETPLLITGLGNGEENSSKSLPYIPGSALRGALVARYSAVNEDLPFDDGASTLFFSDQVCFLNAYPVDQSGNRMLPVPASWRMKKGEDIENAEIADFAFAADEGKDMSVHKPFKGNNPNQSLYAYKPDEELAIHIASQERGIVNGESMVFQYQSLTRGQRFAALVIADDTSSLAEIEKLLTPKTIYLGRSRSAGYGKAFIESVKRVEEPEARSVPLPVTTITLLSDAILRDSNGQPTHDLNGYLSRRFGRTIQHQAAYVKSAEIGGFNRKWRLPLPQMPALGMGSVFVYSAGALSASELVDLQQRGIGERRVDGFGRLAVNWIGDSSLHLTKEEKPETPTPILSLAPASQALARTMSERLLRHLLEQNLVAEVNRYDKVKGNVTNHQLARIRDVLRQALDAPEKYKEINLFLKSLKDTAREQLHNTRLHKNSMAGVRLELWLEERLKEQDGLKILKVGKETDFPVVAGLRAPMTDALKREYTLRLMEAVMDRVMKLNGKEA